MNYKIINLTQAELILTQNIFPIFAIHGRPGTVPFEITNIEELERISKGDYLMGIQIGDYI